MAKSIAFSIAAVFCLATLLGCRDSTVTGAPESAEAFIEALYLDKDMSKLMRFSGPQLREVFAHYRKLPPIQQNILALELDTLTFVQATKQQLLVLSEHANMVDIGVLIDGTRDGLKVTDDRRLRLEKLDDRWVVIQILR